MHIKSNHIKLDYIKSACKVLSDKLKPYAETKLNITDKIFGFTSRPVVKDFKLTLGDMNCNTAPKFKLLDLYKYPHNSKKSFSDLLSPSTKQGMMELKRMPA